MGPTRAMTNRNLGRFQSPFIINQGLAARAKLANKRRLANLAAARAKLAASRARNARRHLIAYR